MQWYQVIFQLIDMRSFSNLWYWIVLAVLWSTTSHWVLGVPFDMITRAKREGGSVQQDLETMVRINCQRMLHITDVAGTGLVAMLFFILSVLLMLGIYYHIEFAQALLFLLVPMVIIMLLSIRSARLIGAGDFEGEALHKRLFYHRISTQVIGMLSIFVTSLYGMWFNLTAGVLH